MMSQDDLPPTLPPDARSVPPEALASNMPPEAFAHNMPPDALKPPPNANTVYLGDIVLLNNADGTQSPAIVTSVIDQGTVTLGVFGLVGYGGSSDPVHRGTNPGEWQKVHRPLIVG